MSEYLAGIKNDTRNHQQTVATICTSASEAVLLAATLSFLRPRYFARRYTGLFAV
jgi:hypothetical protein